MSKNKLALFAVMAMLALVSGSWAQEHKHTEHTHDAKASAAPAASAPSGKLNLSPALKELLAQEMQAIQAGMQELAPAIASGDAAGVARVGKKMKDSYILAQKLSKAQMEELHHALPADFAAMDHEFHDFAGMLAKSAEAGQWNVIPYLHYRLTEACVNCHGSWAHEKFPALAGKGTSRKGLAPMYKAHMGMTDHAGAPMDHSKMMEQCAMGKMGMEGMHNPKAHKEMMEKCMSGDTPCPMNEKGECVKDQCVKAKTGDCPMMDQAAPGKPAEKTPPSGK